MPSTRVGELHPHLDSDRVHLEPGGAGSDLGFWGLIAIWEIGYLDLRVLLSPRFLRVAWRRRDEVIGMLGALRGKGSFSQRMAGQFAEADRPAA